MFHLRMSQISAGFEKQDIDQAPRVSGIPKPSELISRFPTCDFLFLSFFLGGVGGGYFRVLFGSFGGGGVEKLDGQKSD